MSECIEWVGRHDRDGYAFVQVPGVRGPRRVHILRYVAKYGAVPAGLVLDHFACDNKGCVNPDHVRPVSQRENTLRCPSRWLLVSPSMRCPQGHDLERNLGTRSDGYPKCLACMRGYQAAYLARKAASANA